MGFLALALALTTATQLRMPGLPIGPGEVLLVLWLVGSTAHLTRRGWTVDVKPQFRPFVLFWAVAITLTCTGWLVASVRNIDVPDGIRTFTALILCALFVLTMVTRQDLPELILRVIPPLFIGIVVSLGVAWLLFMAGGHALPINPYIDTRFRGWALNPNQAAMSLIPTPFLLVMMMGCSRYRQKIAYVIAFVICLALGIATGSDGLQVSWVGGVIAVLMSVFGKQLLSLGRGVARTLLALSALALTLALGIWLIGGGSQTLSDEAHAIYSKNNQGDTRFSLWKSSIDVIKLSPLVGLGPGTFAGVDEAFDQKEPHNTYLYWGTSAGLLGLGAYLSLCGLILLRSWKSGRAIIFGAAVAVMISSTFSSQLRHPLLWFYLMMMVSLSTPMRAEGWEAPRHGNS